MEAIRYDKKYLDQWDSFVDGSNNGTIFHTRKFLSYHPAGRFKDSSLLFFSKRKLISVLTGAEVMKDGAKCLISHQGASYGGFIYNDDLSLKQAFELTERLVEFAEENGYQRLIITHSPFVYQSRYNNYVDFAFISRGFRYLKREVSSIVVLDVDESDVFSLFKPEARTAVRKAERSGVLIKRSDDFQQYYRILKSNLALRHNVKPAHSLEELIRIQKLFPDDVELIGAFVKDKMIAGVVNFYCNRKAVLVFYISHDPEYQNYRAVNLLFHNIIGNAIRKGLQYLDFGLFTVNMDPNWGLGRFKENFGARGILRDTFVIDLGS